MGSARWVEPGAQAFYRPRLPSRGMKYRLVAKQSRGEEVSFTVSPPGVRCDVVANDCGWTTAGSRWWAGARSLLGLDV